MDGFGFVKFRIVAVQNWFDISKASFSLINHSPVANANGPYNGIATNPIAFYSNDSYDPDGDALTYLWDFGDESTSVEENPTHTYTSPNNYTVTLTVTDTYGKSAADTTTATIFSETFETIRPTGAYNPDAWITPANGYDWNPRTYTYKKSISKKPSISFGGSTSNESINAWQDKTNYWHSAWLYVTFEGLAAGAMNDLIEIVVTDKNGNLKHTILPSTIGITKKEFAQKLNMSDWGDGFNNIANLRVRVNGYRTGGADGAEARVFDVRIDGDTASPVKDYTRGIYSSLPSDNSNLTTVYTPAEVIDVDSDDDDRVSQTGNDLLDQYAIHQFKRKTSDHSVTITWNGQLNSTVVEAYAQSFKPNNSGLLTGVGIFLEKVGSPNGSLRVRIKSELGGEVLAESNSIAESSITFPYSWKTFTFVNPASVVAGNTYYIEIWRNKFDTINYPEVTMRDCPDFEGFASVRNGGNWQSGGPGGYSILFKVYIDGVVDVDPICYVPITPDRGIAGLDWQNIYLEANNRMTSSWVLLDTDLYNGSTTDINLSGAVTSDDYFDNDWITLRVHATTTNAITSLTTDMIDFTASLTGTVTDSSTGLPISNVIVTVTDSFNTYTTATDSNGKYTVSGLAQGSFTATFEKSGYFMQTINGTLIAGETLILDTQLEPKPPLIVTITSPQDGAVVNSSPITVTGNVSNNANVTVNGIQASVTDGIFSASIPLIEGQNTITATATDQYSQTASHSITVTLVTKGTVSGRVTDASTGLPISSATVSVTDSLNITQNTPTDSDGNYTITAVASGTFQGNVLKDGYHPYTFSGTMSPGQTIIINAALNPILPIISNIDVINITTDSATITWTTDQLSDSRVEYGETTAYGSLVTDPLFTTSHSLTLTNLTPGTTYHFKATSTNNYGFSSSSNDDTFTTRAFMATTIGDYGNVTVMEVTGNYNAKNPDGSINALPRQEIAKEFLRLHPDTYDFLVFFSNFDFSMPDPAAKAFYLEVKNDIQGIGKPLFDSSALFGSNGKLQGTIDMGNISTMITNPVDPMFEETINTLSHEQLHRWGASVKFRDGSGNISTALLGKDGNHWSFLLDTDASVLYGNDWQDNGNGTFTSTGGGKYYSPLDLYLMGFYQSSQVPSMLLIDNQNIDPAGLPEAGATISGTPLYITIDDIIAAEGERLPSASASQKIFKTGFILIARPGLSAEVRYPESRI